MRETEKPQTLGDFYYIIFLLYFTLF